MRQQTPPTLDIAKDSDGGKRHAQRAQRTRELLLDSMYQLLLEKDYAEIKVQDLLDRAGVARSTFYAHFHDKEDLLVAGYESIGVPDIKICDAPDQRRVVLDVSTWLFAATARHAALTTSFFNHPSQNIVLAHLETTLLIQVREHYRKQGFYDADPLRGEVAVRCFVGALVGLWLWWVRRDYPCSAEEVTKIFDELLNNGSWPPLPA